MLREQYGDGAQYAYLVSRPRAPAGKDQGYFGRRRPIVRVHWPGAEPGR